MEQPEKKELPLGGGEEFQKERRKETLPALEVKNTVLWVNPAFEGTAPFRLEKGKPTNLGLFFTPGEWSEEKVQRLIIMPERDIGRSGLLGSVIFKDREGRLYRDVDLKGIGYFTRFAGGAKVEGVRPELESREAQGLMDYDYALRDKKYSEKFIKAGIRTHRVIAIVKLKEIVGNRGKRIPISEAKNKGIVPGEMRPVAVLRAFGTKERIGYLRSHFMKEAERSQKALEDAKTIAAQELGRNPQDFSMKEYLEWFAKTLGKQVAQIRKLELHHGYLTPHNITLDCRIVDLDSVTPIREKAAEVKWSVEDLYNDDYDRAQTTLAELISAVSNLSDVDLFTERLFDYFFKRAYQEELKEKNKESSI